MCDLRSKECCNWWVESYFKCTLFSANIWRCHVQVFDSKAFSHIKLPRNLFKDIIEREGCSQICTCYIQKNMPCKCTSSRNINGMKFYSFLNINYYFSFSLLVCKILKWYKSNSITFLGPKFLIKIFLKQVFNFYM